MTSSRFPGFVPAEDRRARPILWSDAVLVVLVGAYILGAVARVPFHGDESGLMALSRTAASRFSGEIHRSDRAQREAIATGVVTPSLIGWAFDIAGVASADIPGFWNWGSEVPASQTRFDLNRELGNVPSPAVLTIARVPSTIGFFLSTVVVLWLAFRLTASRLAAYSSVLIYATTPAILVNGARAMQEGAMLLLTSLVAAAGVALMDVSSKATGRRWWLVAGFVGFGLIEGLALAAKHNAALTLIAVNLALLLERVVFGSGRDRVRWMGLGTRAVFLGSSSAVCGAVFLAVTPLWYSTSGVVACLSLAAIGFLLAWESPPAGRARPNRILSLVLLGGLALAWSVSALRQPVAITLEVRTRLMRSQMESYGWMTSRLERGFFLINELFLDKAQYGEEAEWVAYPVIAAEIRAFEASAFQGRPTGWAPAVVGLLLSIGGAWRVQVRERTAAGLLVTVWLALPALLLWMSNPLPWQRYYIGLYPPLAILMGGGVLAVEQAARHHRARPAQERLPLPQRENSAARVVLELPGLSWGISDSSGSAAQPIGRTEL